MAEHVVGHVASYGEPALGGEAKPVNPHPEYGGDDVEDDE